MCCTNFSMPGQTLPVLTIRCMVGTVAIELRVPRRRQYPSYKDIGYVGKEPRSGWPNIECTAVVTNRHNACNALLAREQYSVATYASWHPYIPEQQLA